MRWFWLDRFTEFVSESHATAHKAVSLSEDFLHDHFPGYPVMPSSLIAEGMAQTSGLLVSEAYKFSELVVLAKFSSCRFEGEVRPGQVLRYEAKIDKLIETGASATVTATVGGEQRASAEIFFARLSGDSPTVAAAGGRRLFDPLHLLHWLRLVGVFEVGVHKDNSRMRPEDYAFEVR